MRRLDRMDQNLCRFEWRQRSELFADQVYALELLRVIEQIVTPGGRLRNVDRRENALVAERAIETDLHVARYFVYLEDEVVGLAIRLDETRRQHGQRATFLGISCGTEELLRLDKRLGIDATGHQAAFPRHQVVISAR